MALRYMSEILTPAVRAAEEHYYQRSIELDPVEERDALGEQEIEFIAARDSFYLATVNSEGWPYVQHRGGPRGFLKVLDAHTLAFDDLRGNRQLVSTGNLAGNDKVSLLLMDYPNRARLKILGRARVQEAREPKSKVERVMVIEVVGFDWNCPAHITPRYTEEELREMLRLSGRADKELLGRQLFQRKGE